VKKSLAELIPAEYNPRRISDAAKAGLKASIKSFGLVQPIVWNAKTGNVVSGHQRLTVLKEMGEVETDVVVVELDDIKEKALNVTMNNKAIEGEFDDEALGALLEEVKAEFGDTFQEIRLNDLEIPNWDDSAVPEGANKDLSQSQLTVKLAVTFPKESEFLKTEVQEEIQRLIKEHFDGHGIQVA
jgi:hypothetical protein